MFAQWRRSAAVECGRQALASPIIAGMETTDLYADVVAIWPDHAPTPLIDAPALACAAGVAQVLLKLETARPFGNFKSLGGTVAGLRAIARAVGAEDVRSFLNRPSTFCAPPVLVCASDGNHGLSVAAAAQRAGGKARVFLPDAVSGERAARVAALGAQVVRIAGTYDDAVSAATEAAFGGAGLLIPDTTADPDDPVVSDVMAGYRIITCEIRDELELGSQRLPTHQFIQAGVGGLAAAMADGLGSEPDGGPIMVVVEPSSAACVAHALRSGRTETIPGALATAAEMLSCGMASEPAVRRLRHHGAKSLIVDEARLHAAVAMLKAFGLDTTASGAAGLAGLLDASQDPDIQSRLTLSEDSRVLLIVTEGTADRINS